MQHRVLGWTHPLLGDLLGADEADSGIEHLASEDGAMEPDGKVLLEAEYRVTARDERRDAPVRQKRDLQDVIGEAELGRPAPEASVRLRSLGVRTLVGHREQPDGSAIIERLAQCLEEHVT